MKMKQTKRIVLFAAMLLAVGCATTTYQPLVDRPGPNYAADLNDCRAYAERVSGAGTNAVVGAVAGAVAGALIARLIGRDVERGAVARVGAATGAFGGAGQGYQNEKEVIRNCLRGRGHNVLN